MSRSDLYCPPRLATSSVAPVWPLISLLSASYHLYAAPVPFDSIVGRPSWPAHISNGTGVGAGVGHSTMLQFDVEVAGHVFSVCVTV